MKIVIISFLISFVKTTGFKIINAQHRGDNDVTFKQIVIEDPSKLEPIELKDKADDLDQNFLLVIEKLLSLNPQDKKFIDAKLGTDIKTAIKNILELKEIELKEKAAILEIDLPLVEKPLTPSKDEKFQFQGDEAILNEHSIGLTDDISSEIAKLKQEADKQGPNYQEVVKKVLELELSDSKFKALELGSDTLTAIKAILKLSAEKLKEKATVLGIDLPINEIPAPSKQAQLSVQENTLKKDELQADTIITQSEIEGLRKKVNERGKDFQLVFDKLISLNPKDPKFLAANLGANLKNALEKLLEISNEELKEKFADLNVSPSPTDKSLPPDIKSPTPFDPADLKQKAEKKGLDYQIVIDKVLNLEPTELNFKALNLGPDTQTVIQNLLDLSLEQLKEKASILSITLPSVKSSAKPSGSEGLNFQADGVAEKNHSLSNVDRTQEIKDLLKKADKLRPEFRNVIDELLFIDPIEQRFKAAELGPDTQTAIQTLLGLPLEKLKAKAKVLGIEITENEKLSGPSDIRKLEEQADEAPESRPPLSKINTFPELEKLKEKAQKLGPNFNLIFEKILSLNPDDPIFLNINLGSDIKTALENLFFLTPEQLQLTAVDFGLDLSFIKTKPLLSKTTELKTNLKDSDTNESSNSLTNTLPGPNKLDLQGDNTLPGPKKLDLQGDEPEKKELLGRDDNQKDNDKDSKPNIIADPLHKPKPETKKKKLQNNRLDAVKNNEHDKKIKKIKKQSQKVGKNIKNKVKLEKKKITKFPKKVDKPKIKSPETVKRQVVNTKDDVSYPKYYKDSPVSTQNDVDDGSKTLNTRENVLFEASKSPHHFLKKSKIFSENDLEDLKLKTKVDIKSKGDMTKVAENLQHDDNKSGGVFNASVELPYDVPYNHITLKFSISRCRH